MAKWGRPGKPNPTKDELARRTASRERYRGLSKADRKEQWIDGRDKDRVRADDKQRKANPSPSESKKRAARAKVRAAGKGGKCQVCGEAGQAHHGNYSKPLQVEYLCSQHHAGRHSGA